MEDIYDRATWPPPESNPLVLMLQRGDEWYNSREITVALKPGKPTPRGAPTSNIKQILRVIGDAETTVTNSIRYSVAEHRNVYTGGVERMYSRKALVLIALRSNTPNAAAFRDWLAAKTAGEVSHG